MALRCRGRALFFRSFSQSSQPPLAHSPASLQPFLDRQGTVIFDSIVLGAESERHALSGVKHLFRLEGHNKILDLHRTFLEAGSDVISSLSYQVSFEMFTAASTFTDGSLPGGNITAEKNQLRYSNDVLRTSVELAKKARNDFWGSSPASALQGPGVTRLRPLVAATVGPAGDNVALWTAATDPTTAVHGLPDEVISRYYRRKLRALCRARPDLLGLERLPSLHEAHLALSALSEVATELAKLGVATPPACVSFLCLSESATAAGDDLGHVAALLSKEEAVAAVGVSCVSPSHLEPLLRLAKAHLSLRTLLLARANSGEISSLRKAMRRWHGAAGEGGVGEGGAAGSWQGEAGRGEVLDGSHALRMQRAGADGIGGSCGVTAGQIRAFREALVMAGAAGGAGATPTAPARRGVGDAPDAPCLPGPTATQGTLEKPYWLAVVGIGVVCCVVGMLAPASKPPREGDG